jgi:phospholipase/carboxylesterase
MAFADLTWRTYRPAEGFYTSEVEEPRRLPVRTFLPTGYEPNYPYPLLVFFHGQGGNEEQILRLAPRLSRRNYICIGLRGPTALGLRADGRVGYGWGSEGLYDTLLEEYVIRAVEQTRRQYHVHSERIYLAGFCEGASIAYRLGLTFPNKFGGLISLNGAMSRYARPRLRLPEVRQLRVLIGHGIANAVVPLTHAREDSRLLYTAGLSVRMHTYPATHRLHPDMLRDVNRWIMEQCNV